VALHQKRRLRLPGLAEVSALILTVATIVTAALWFRSAAMDAWDITSGAVVGARVHHTHYNAEGTRLKVDCEYEYVVGQQSYRGYWAGFWPDAGSPNALLREELDVLQPGYALSVYYNTDDPRASDPHMPGSGRSVRYAWVFALTCVITGYYCFRVYPRIRLG